MLSIYVSESLYQCLVCHTSRVRVRGQDSNSWIESTGWTQLTSPGLVSPTRLGWRARTLGSNSALELMNQVRLASWLDSYHTLGNTIRFECRIKWQITLSWTSHEKAWWRSVLVCPLPYPCGTVSKTIHLSRIQKTLPCPVFAGFSGCWDSRHESWD